MSTPSTLSSVLRLNRPRTGGAQAAVLLHRRVYVLSSIDLGILRTGAPPDQAPADPCSPGICNCTSISTNFADPRLKDREGPPAPSPRFPTYTPKPSLPTGACACAHGAPSAAPPLTNLGVQGLAAQARLSPPSQCPARLCGRTSSGEATLCPDSAHHTLGLS